MPSDHLFCVIVGDCRLSIAETLMANFQVLTWDMKREKREKLGSRVKEFVENKAAEKRFDIAARAAELAKQFGVEGTHFANEAIQQSEEVTQPRLFMMLKRAFKWQKQ